MSNSTRFSSIRLRGAATVLCLVAFLVLLPIVAPLNDYVFSIAISLLVFVILSQSWNLMGGYTGQVNLGLAAYFGTGAISYHLAYVAGAPFALVMVAGALASTFLACIIGPPTLRLKGAYFGIGTLAVAEVLRLIVHIVYHSVQYAPPRYFATFTLTKAYHLSLAVTVLAMLTAWGITKSRLGLILQAIRDDEDAANSSGINPAKYKMVVFMISSFLAGLAGGVYAYYQGAIYPTQQFSPNWSIGPLIAATVGGWGTLTGPIWGSVVYIVLQEVLGRYIREAHLIITGIIFILVIMLLPTGLVRSGVHVRAFLAALFKRGRPEKVR